VTQRNDTMAATVNRYLQRSSTCQHEREACGRLLKKNDGRPWATAALSANLETPPARGADALQRSQGNGDHGGPMLQRRRALQGVKVAGTGRRSGEPRRAGAGCATPGLDGISNTDRGGRGFKYRPAPGPSRPSNHGCASQIIRKSSSIYIRLLPPPLVHPSEEKPVRGAGEPGAAVRHRCPVSGNGAYEYFPRQRAAVGSLVDSGAGSGSCVGPSSPRPRQPPSSPPAMLPVTLATV